LTRWSSRVFQRVGRTTARPPSSSMASIACTLRSRRTVPFSAFVRAGTALGRKPRDETLLSWFSAAVQLILNFAVFL
jgi:hypothetical protein